MTDTPEAVRLADDLAQLASEGAALIHLQSGAYICQKFAEASALLRRIPELEAEVKQLAKQAASVRNHLTDALAFLLCEKDGNDDPHHLIWCGGAVPEPWGEIWQKYLPDAESLAEAAFKSANDWGLAFDKAEAQALDDAIAERDQLRAELEGRWQPIETAPKDGTVVILGRAGDGDEVSSVVTTGHWQEAEEDGVDYMGADAGFVDEHYQEFTPGRSFGNPKYMYPPSQPTHWMPLPAAPTPPHADQKGQ